METIITCWHLIAAAVLCGLVFNSLRYDALALAITAPSDDHANRAIALANDLASIAISQGATDRDIEHCKKAAVCVVEYLNQ